MTNLIPLTLHPSTSAAPSTSSVPGPAASPRNKRRRDQPAFPADPPELPPPSLDEPPELPGELWDTIFSFLHRDLWHGRAATEDLYKLRQVCQLFKSILDSPNQNQIWPIRARRITRYRADRWSDVATEDVGSLQGVAWRAIQHMKKVLGAQPPHVLRSGKNWAEALRDEIGDPYHERTDKDIKNNCICIFELDGELGSEYLYTLNFLPRDLLYAPRLEQDDSPVLARELMLSQNKHIYPGDGRLHAEIRAMKSGGKLVAVDKPMCIFCAITIKLKGTPVPGHAEGHYHTRTLQWYTFFPSLLIDPSNMQRAFGPEFLEVWSALNNKQRKLLLELCIASLGAPWCPDCRANTAVIVDRFERDAYYCNHCQTRFRPD